MEPKAHTQYSTTSRRRFLGQVARASAVLAGAGAIGTFLAQDSAAATTTLSIPDLLDSATDGDVTVFALTAETGTHNVLSSVTSSTAGFNGSYLGPTIRVANGEEVRMDITNDIGEDMTVHWHGAHVPAAVDGGVQGSFSSGTTYQAAFTVNQEAATLWYHPHTMSETAKQVSLGLAGMLIVTDDTTASADLPSDYGVDDIPLILQCQAVDSDGSIAYNLSTFQSATDLRFPVLVNGTNVDDTTLSFTATKTRIRFRLLNASLADIFTISRTDGATLTQIATDGGYLTESLEVDEIRLVAGSRAEIIMDVTDTVNLQAVVTTGWIQGGSGTYDFLQITASGTDTPVTLPTTLNTITRYDTADADVTRTIQLTSSGMDMGINGVAGTSISAMESNKISVNLGAFEVWTIENTTELDHSFHVHDVPFQLISVNGTAASGADLGWLDTTEVIGGATVVIALKFTDYADSSNYYMLHCHIAQHEDEGMMTFLEVVPSS